MTAACALRASATTHSWRPFMSSCYHPCTSTSTYWSVLQVCEQSDSPAAVSYRFVLGWMQASNVMLLLALFGVCGPLKPSNPSSRHCQGICRQAMQYTVFWTMTRRDTAHVPVGITQNFAVSASGTYLCCVCDPPRTQTLLTSEQAKS